jgi:hypothetical protein
MSRGAFAVLAAFVTLTGVGVVIALTLAAQRWRARRRLVAAAFGVFGAAVALQAPWWAVDLAVLLAAVAGALLLERALTTAGSVGAFVTVAALVDLFSMSRGPSRAIVEAYRRGSSDLLLYLALSVPIGHRMAPIVGVGDLLVAGTAGVALIRLGYRTGVVLGAIAAGLMCALVYGLMRGGAPALPFVAPALIALVVAGRSGRPHRAPAGRG